MNWPKQLLIIALQKWTKNGQKMDKNSNLYCNLDENLNYGRDKIDC
jgi:hypothetical protein